MPGPSDEILMSRVQAGDLSALGTLFGRHHQQVHALCYRLTGDLAATDDLVQESFLRVLRYASSFGARSKFSTWLYRLVRNRCLDHMTAANRETQNRKKLAIEMAAQRAPREKDERHELLRQALQRLPPEKREVLVLSRYQNLKYREIAEICEVSVEAIKVRAHRAMGELRQIFQELEKKHEL